jgi:hypothetical protein
MKSDQSTRDSAREGDAAARAAIDDCAMFELYRPTLDEQNTTLRGTWVRGIDGEYLIRTSVKAQPGDIVSVLNAKGESRRYTLVEKSSEGWVWAREVTQIVRTTGG